MGLVLGLYVHLYRGLSDGGSRLCYAYIWWSILVVRLLVTVYHLSLTDVGHITLHRLRPVTRSASWSDIQTHLDWLEDFVALITDSH
jgi:hypothetical protein